MAYYYPLKRMNKVERRRTIDNLLQLRSQLDMEIPQKTATDTLLLATWNIREFGNNRRKESLHYIAEIISQFDLVAVQEVASNLKGLKDLMKLLNPGWGYLVTDSTEGAAGKSERMAFVYDKNKIMFQNMAGQIVLPKDKLIAGDSPEQGLQFARTPYTAAFQAGWFHFVLTTVHIFFGDLSKEKMKRREEEIDKITSVLSKRAKKEDTSYVLLGDFNIPDVKHPMMQTLEKYGFAVPGALKIHPTDLGQKKHYDQIAFNLKLDKTMTVFSENEQKAGAFNFCKSVYREKDFEIYRNYFPEKMKEKTEEELKKYYLSTWRTFQMSDHLPLWVELKIDFSNQYLEKLKII